MRALIKPVMAFIRASSKKGQTLVEYALILAIISVIAIGVFGLLNTRIVSIFSQVSNLLDTAQSSH